ncbi:mitochondrial pyruvate carrier 2-like [Diabrotica virgifera virgifera]|uniref:Mitochondrial pyruvate carrier n=1 Tax=Diabrotica virgifera virgifera TaxID=50390 RepID=A0ABM5KEZ8_DIAVI|nr:mitochondrial pyruvate carrier 2-like [Diabrotica virgifera virgifera]
MSSLYKNTMAALDKIVPTKFHPIWMHPAGPKTVFFWAPVFKWGLVIAGIADLQRPAELLSTSQITALVVTGLIWSRYSMVIIPKNYTLLSVNAFIAITQGVQLIRVLHYQYSNK